MAAIDDVDQIVIVMLENRSFDSLLGYLSLDDWKALSPRKDPVNGLLTAQLAAGGYANPVVENGPARQPFAFDNDNLWDTDLPHGRWPIMAQLHWVAGQKPGYAMNGFVKAQFPNGGTPAKPTCMGYFTPPYIPITDFLAREFRVCDRWFCSIPADTHPNRLMSISGYTNIDTTGSLTRQDLTVLSYLEYLGKRNAVSVFAKRASFYCMLYDFAIEALLGSDRFFRYEAFENAWLAAPTDPHVWIVEPAYADSPPLPWGTQGAPDDGHPPAQIARSERFLHDVYSTLIKNQERWARTVMIVYYDEHGGCFDHEPPLRITTSPPQAGVWQGFPSTGPRVPALIVSPYASRGSTCTLPMDHTSVLRMIANKFARTTQPPFSDQVARRPVGSAWDALDLATPRGDIPVPPDPPPEPAAMPPGSSGPVAQAFAAAFHYVELHTGRVLRVLR
jgi:phospholipase C